MEENRISRELQKDLVIPEIVLQKTDSVLKQIQQENGGSRLGRKKRRLMWPLIAAAILALGSITAYAAYMRWSRAMEQEFHATPQEQIYLEEQQIAAPVENNNSVTAGGVTITAQQSIVDSQYAYISFKIEGYELEDGKEPCFESISVTVNGSRDVSWTGDFYTGVHYDGEKGIFVYDENGASAEDADGTVTERFAGADGSMEYILKIYPNETDAASRNGAAVQIVFSNLGIIENKAEYRTRLEAEWALDIPLHGSDQVRSAALSAPLGDSGAVVTAAEISPISIRVEYDFPAKETAIEGIDENGNPITSFVNEEPPALTGVRLKDGTLLTGIDNGGIMTWDETGKTCIVSRATNCILETEQVDALLFIKEYPDTNRKLTVEDLYIVPIE